MPAQRTVRRRDVLLLRTGETSRCMELSCQALYMQYVDLERTHGAEAPDQASYEEPWLGEPPAVTVPRTLRALFDTLARELEDVDLLRVLDCTWIVDETLTRELKQLVSTVVTRGGRVEFVPGDSAPPKS